MSRGQRVKPVELRDVADDDGDEENASRWSVAAEQRPRAYMILAYLSIMISKGEVQYLDGMLWSEVSLFRI